MKNMGLVRGSLESAIPFEICVDTVYLRFNIEPVPPTDNDDDMDAGGEQFQYLEIQYDLREWLQFVTESVIDVGSFALNSGAVKDLEAAAFGTETGAVATFNQAYAGLPEQKPFTFNTKFTARRST